MDQILVYPYGPTKYKTKVRAYEDRDKFELKKIKRDGSWKTLNKEEISDLFQVQMRDLSEERRVV